MRRAICCIRRVAAPDSRDAARCDHPRRRTPDARDAAPLPALSVACRCAGAENAHYRRAAARAAVQGGSGLWRRLCAEGRGRCDGAESTGCGRSRCGDVRRADGGRLCRRAAEHHGIRQSAQRRVRKGGAGCDATAGDRHVPPSASIVAAFSPGTPHRRRDQSGRARDQEHRFDALFPVVQHRADDPRTCAGAADLRQQVRHVAGRIDAGDGGQLYRLYPLGHGLAGQAARGDERPRYRGGGACGRFAAEFRNGQIFQCRGAGGESLCQCGRCLCQGGGEIGKLAGVAQYGPVSDHQCDAGHGDGGGRLGLVDGAVHRGRCGVRFHPAKPAVPPARHARLGLSHHSARRDRHGRDVRPDRYAGGSEGCARRRAADRRAGRGAVRGCPLRL